MKYSRKYILYCLLTAISGFYFCPELSAQGRSVKVRKRYAYLMTEAREAYQNYNFERAESAMTKYKRKLKQRRVSADSLALAFDSQIQRAKRLLTYAESIQLVDSLQFPRQDIKQILSQRSPMLAKTLSFKVDSANIDIAYKTELGGFTLYADKQQGNTDLYRRELSSFEDLNSKSLSENINTKDDEFNPFLLSTGYTLIFARQSKDGIGGADLYYTRYNTEKKTFYKAKILGMPFNSIYNDYLFAYDDKQNLSYLVSDRFCPKDSLVLYRFVGLPKVIAEDSKVAGTGAKDEEANGLFSNTLDTSYHLAPAVREKEGKIYLPLKSGVVIRSWEGFRSSEALSYYRDYIAYQEQIKERRQYQKELRKRYKDGVLIATEELGVLEQEINQLSKNIKSALIKCKNAEIIEREL